jgi:hypothetical protein
MEVNIEDLVSTVRAVDSNSLLTPETMRTIVQTVLRAVQDQQAHQQRVASETRVRSVRDELEGEQS